jgi:tetratricopeptide (TPR) repeat protein
MSKPDRLESNMKAAADYRLAGEINKAEEIYAGIATREEPPFARGYGIQHLALCIRSRAETARDEGEAERAEALFAQAGADFEQAAQEYERVGDFVRASAARLDIGVLYLRQGDPDLAVTAIRQSIAYLKGHERDESDQVFAEEHLGIKYARLAEALLAAGDTEAAAKILEQAQQTPQRNEYFVMVTEGIAGDVYRARADTDRAVHQFKSALKKAKKFGDNAYEKKYREALDSLSAG